LGGGLLGWLPDDAARLPPPAAAGGSMPAASSAASTLRDRLVDTSSDRSERLRKFRCAAADAHAASGAAAGMSSVASNSAGRRGVGHHRSACCGPAIHHAGRQIASMRSKSQLSGVFFAPALQGLQLCRFAGNTRQ